MGKKYEKLDYNKKSECLLSLSHQIDLLKDTNSKSCDDYNYSDKLKLKVKNALRDIKVNHNHSWAVEMFLRNCNNLDKISISYRGNKISYGEMYSNAYLYAKSLKSLGFVKGDEVPVCISNIPEFVYMFLAVSFIGAKLHVVGDWFDKDYLENILKKTKSKSIFVSDDIYGEISDVIEKANIENIIMFSLTDSLKKNDAGQKFNPYQCVDDLFHEFSNKVEIYKSNLGKKIMTCDEFINYGNNYEDMVFEQVGLSDVCAITYTSGTTNPGCPKGVIQPNRSFITLSRFKESDVSGMPEMKNLTVLAHIPTYTHMELTCAISDTLYCNCTLAMEPFYSREFFPYSLMINKPNFVPASAGFWVHLCKLLNYDEKFKNADMSYLMLPTVTGEGCSPGEEKFFNYTSRRNKFGTAKLPFPLAPVTFSIGGGTSESSGIFVTLFKSLQEKKFNYLIKKETLGLTPHKFAEVEVLNENGDYCNIGEPGLLVANSPCNMIGYTDSSLDDSINVIDSNGKKWLSLGTFSYKSDKFGRIKMKGRLKDKIQLQNGEIIPYYAIEDTVLLDTKNIMSCSFIQNYEGYYICNLEMQPTSQNSINKILKSCIERLNNLVPIKIMENVYFRIRSFEESFPLAPSGKRNTSELINETVDEKFISYISFDNEISAKKKVKK